MSDIDPEYVPLAGWGLMKPERRAEPVAMTPQYEGMGEELEARLSPTPHVYPDPRGKLLSDLLEEMKADGAA